MKSHIKHPILLVILILLIYSVAIILWNTDFTLGTVLLVFVNFSIGIIGILVSAIEITKVKVKNIFL